MSAPQNTAARAGPLTLLQRQERRRQDVRAALRKAHEPANRPVRQFNIRR